jgi:hypothetical protein
VGEEGSERERERERERDAAHSIRSSKAHTARSHVLFNQREREGATGLRGRVQ